MNAMVKPADSLPMAQPEAASLLRSLLAYNPSTGEFTWRVARPGKTKAGSVAGTVINGRIYIRFQGRQQLAHRLAFLHVTGELPRDEVDHKDGNPANNAWENLRLCSHAQNGQNRKASKRNKSGLLGVSKHGDGWQATICVNKKYTHLGRFKTAEAAHHAYVEAKRKMHEFSPEVRK